MQGEFFKRTMQEISKKLHHEAQARNGITVEQWLRIRNAKRFFYQQLKEIIDNPRQS